MRVLLLPLLVAAAAPAPAQTGTLDQDSPFANVSFNGNLTNWDRAQTILVGSTGQLEGITFEVYGIPPASSTVNVYGPTNTPSPPAGAPAGTFQLPGQGSGWVEVFVDMTAANIQMNAGEYWCVEIIGAPGSCDFKGNQGFPTAMYPHEFWETAGTTFYQQVTDRTRLGLQTWMLPPGPTIALTGTCPGIGTLLLDHFTPGGVVGIGFGFGTGAVTLPGGPCAGTTVHLTSSRVIALVAVNALGQFAFPGNLTPAACGGYVQVLDLATCVPSNVISI